MISRQPYLEKYLHRCAKLCKYKGVYCIIICITKTLETMSMSDPGGSHLWLSIVSCWLQGLDFLSLCSAELCMLSLVCGPNRCF